MELSVDSADVISLLFFSVLLNYGTYQQVVANPLMMSYIPQVPSRDDESSWIYGELAIFGPFVSPSLTISILDPMFDLRRARTELCIS